MYSRRPPPRPKKTSKLHHLPLGDEQDCARASLVPVNLYRPFRPPQASTSAFGLQVGRRREPYPAAASPPKHSHLDEPLGATRRGNHHGGRYSLPLAAPPQAPVKSSTSSSSKRRRTLPAGLTSSPRAQVGPTIHSCPTEVLLSILSFAERSYDTPLDRQRQRKVHASVCKAWNRLDARTDHYAVKGFKQTRRLARLFSMSNLENSGVETFNAEEETSSDSSDDNDSESDCSDGDTSGSSSNPSSLKVYESPPSDKPHKHHESFNKLIQKVDKDNRKLMDAKRKRLNPPPKPHLRGRRELHRLDIDLTTEDRLGTKQMVADLLARCYGLKELSVVMKGRERVVWDAACISVPLFDAFASQSELIEFELKFERHWTALTLGGDLSRTLQALPHLKRLTLPRVLVPRGSAFKIPFSPCLTHLSLHLFDRGSFRLLVHLLQSSSSTLTHLSLSIGDGTDPSDIPLETSTAFANVSPHLKSFELAMPYLRTKIPAPALPLSAIIGPMASLQTLTLCSRLAPNLSTILPSIPFVSSLNYHVSTETDIRSLEKWLVTDSLSSSSSLGGGIQVKPRLREVQLYCWTYLSYVASRVAIDRGGKAFREAAERRGIGFSSCQRDPPTEEDDYEGP